MKPGSSWFVVLAFNLQMALQAQVPQLINFQGRVAVDGINFNGSGLFKFALVNGDGSASFWNNDGTSAAGSEPLKAVSLTVSQGLYSVLLGDATLTNMTPITATIFTNADVRLRIWFDDGTNGFQQLLPDQRIAAVGYAMMAANVSDGVVTGAKLAPGAAMQNLRASGESGVSSGGIILSESPDAAALVSAGYIKIGQAFLDTEEWQTRPRNVVPFARSRHNAVWTGVEMVIWGGAVSPLISADGLTATGARYDPAWDRWAPVSTQGAPRPGVGSTAVWTGAEMIVWGGQTYDSSGGRYDPAIDTWRTTPLSAAPAPRTFHTAVWSGTEMIVWGGNALTNSGARYNPGRDEWIPVSVDQAPEYRLAHSAVWTGSEMIIWGGWTTGGVALASGARYNPRTDSWKAMPLQDAPTPRYRHTAVWTGTEMVVCGGHNYSETTNYTYATNFGRYSPASDRWLTRLNPNSSLERAGHSAVWTGDEMIIWGGENQGAIVSNGLTYNPAADSWRGINSIQAPPVTADHTAIWTGTSMVIWGGSIEAGLVNTGGRYFPQTDGWLLVSTATNSLPPGRTDHTTVWTGAEMIVWGGRNRSALLDTGFQYNPATDTLRQTPTLGAPSPRIGHTAVWTGSEMIIWGGRGNLSLVDDGNRYDPARRRWIGSLKPNGPTAREGHTAVWTGNEMIIWGGNENLDTGARYRETNGWVTLPTDGSPNGRSGHSAVWTGEQMIIWGGRTGQTPLNSGGRYSPQFNAWVGLTSINGAPSARIGHRTIWTGNEMFIWGGVGTRFGSLLKSGGRYKPATDSWSGMNSNAVPDFATTLEGVAVGAIPTAVWTGSEMIAWGLVVSNRQATSTGARYDPANDLWSPITTVAAPEPRAGHTAVWTGKGMLMYGGMLRNSSLDPALYYYSLSKPVFLYKRP